MMKSTPSVVVEVKQQLLALKTPPQDFLKSLALNSIISVGFFLGSLFIGTYNTALLPIAAAILLLWTLADSSITNQIIFDKNKAKNHMKQRGSYRRFFVINNLTVVILSIPITFLFGLMLVAIVGKWSEIINGMLIGFALIWGWLGISNLMSVVLPFEKVPLKSIRNNHRSTIKYGILYSLPWLIMPVYALVVTAPFLLINWLTGEATLEHKIISVLALFALSMLIWIIGLNTADKLSKNPTNKLQNLLSD